MMLIQYDRQRHTLVTYAAGTPTDHEYVEVAAAIATLGINAAKANAAHVFQVAYMEAGSTNPTPCQRTLIADAKKALEPVPYTFVMVTESSLLRGVMTAVNWLHPLAKNHVFRTAATFEAAIEVCAGAGPFSVEHIMPMLDSLLHAAANVSRKSG